MKLTYKPSLLAIAAVAALTTGALAHDFPCFPSTGNWKNASTISCPEGSPNSTYRDPKHVAKDECQHEK